MTRFIKKHALYLAWVVTLVGLFCSLFFGEMLHHEPCRLCWYQRICLFPLVVILGIAAYKEDSRIGLYTLPFSLFGALLAFYQLLGFFIPAIHSHGLCGYETDCSKDLVELWGFLSFPLVSLVGFLLISFFLWQARSLK